MDAMPDDGQSRSYHGRDRGSGAFFSVPSCVLDGAPKQLFWLSNAVGGVCSSSTSLHGRDLVGDSGDRILADSVSDPGTERFPGLYAEPKLLPNLFI